MDQGNADQAEKPKTEWKQKLAVIGGMFAYMIPLFWMWSSDGYPDSLGVHITAHGKAGMIENWWYSYLLVERRSVLDIVLFLYMWTPILIAIGWALRKPLGKLGGANLSLFADPSRDRPPVE